MFLTHLPEVGKTCDFPQARNVDGVANERFHIGQFSQAFQHQQVDNLWRGQKPRTMWLFLQIGNQCRNVVETRLCLAPKEPIQSREAVPFDRQNFLRCEFAAFARQRPKTAVTLVPASAASDLRHFCNRQPAAARAIKFGEAYKRDMRDIKVQPHADCVSGDEIIHLARLKHRHLRISGTRRQRAHHDRRPATHPAQGFGHRIYLFDRKGDDGGPLWQAR